MPISKREIIKQNEAKQAFKDKIKREIVTFLERNESAFTKDEIVGELFKNYLPEDQEAIKAFINISKLDFSERIKIHTENRKKYYYIE